VLLSHFTMGRDEIERQCQVGETVRDARVASELKRIDRMINAGYALIGAAGLGTIALTFVALRKGPIASALFLIAFVVPIVILLKEILLKEIIIMSTHWLVSAARASLFVRKPAPAKKRDDDYDDEVR
jgi:hypothetical protein